jgi:hypothetical protein
LDCDGTVGGCGNHVSGHFQNLEFLVSVADWELKLLLFHLVNVQKFALVTGVVIIAIQPAVGRWTAVVCRLNLYCQVMCCG